MDEKLEAAKRTKGPCILCGKMSRNVGVFFPDADAEEFHSGLKRRAYRIFYKLCNRHPVSAETIQAVEAELLDEFQRLAAAPNN